MTTTAPTRPSLPRSTGTSPPQPAKIGKASTTLAPPRIVVNAVEGYGKTTLGAYAPNAVVLMTRGETGFVTLRSKNLVPDADCVELDSWPAILQVLDQTDHDTVVIDALGGAERLCHEHVCTKQFNGDWGEKGFGAFQKGYDVSVAEWLLLLQKLDRIRASRGSTIIMLSHCKVRPFKNPMGPDFDRYVADCHEKTWSVTHKWADAVLFGQFQTVTEQDRATRRVKGIGGTERVLYTQRTDAYDAKNRYGMPPAIQMPNDPTQMWETLWQSIKGTPTTTAAAADLPL